MTDRASVEGDRFDDNCVRPLPDTNGTQHVLDSPSSWYILFLLTAAHSLSYVDRQLLNLLIDPVRHSIGLTDTQISFVQGAAFVGGYCLAAPFLGRLVDTGNRRNLLILGVCAWSMCTALCGLADSFWELALARSGVGMSEACIAPVAWSILPQLFSAKKGPQAFSVFAMGSQVGGAFSLLAGGGVIAFAVYLLTISPVLAGYEPWQTAFLVIGIPGIPLAFLLLTFREPGRPSPIHPREGATGGTITLATGISGLVRRAGFYVRIFISVGTLAIVTLCVPSWVPAYLNRVYEISLVDVGLWFGSAMLVSSFSGLLLGPVIAARLERFYPDDAPLMVSALATIGMFASSSCLTLARTPFGAIAIVASLVFFTSLAIPLLTFSCQRVTPAPMRGLVAALYTLCAQVIGYAVGPTLIALITDRVFGDPRMVGHSLQIVCSAGSLITGVGVFSSRSFYRELLRRDQTI